MEEKKAINFTVVPNDEPLEPRVYTNFCLIQHSNADFTLTFCDVPPLADRQIQEIQATSRLRAPVSARLALPVHVIPGLIAALQENFRLHQETFGPPRGPLH